MDTSAAAGNILTANEGQTADENIEAVPEENNNDNGNSESVPEVSENEPDDSIPEGNQAEVTANDELVSEAAQDIAIDAVNFSDRIFREYVSSIFDKDGNGLLSAEEIAAVTKIDVYNYGIKDLSGIEYFTALTDCHKKFLRLFGNSCYI